MFKFFTKKNAGFTLVETLVAISIFSVSLLGLMSILATSISNTSEVKEKNIATYLAQEGIEYMRNMRDTYMLYDAGGAATGWTNFNNKLTGAFCTISGCYFSADAFSGPMNNLPMSSCASGSCPQMKYDASTGKYGYTYSTSSPFTRKITVTLMGSPTYEVKVFSTVFWTQGSGTYNMTLSENLFNWIE